MSSPGKPPKAPDPQQIIELQNKYNRYGINSPFGQVGWSTDPTSGHEVQNITPSDQMQGAIDRAFQLSATPSTPMYVPQGLDQLASGVLGKVGSKYGLTGNNLNTNLKQPYSAPPQGQAMQQGSVNMPNLASMQGGAPGMFGQMTNSGGNQLGGGAPGTFGQMQAQQGLAVMPGNYNGVGGSFRPMTGS
jgi:hypothetical protein